MWSGTKTVEEYYDIVNKIVQENRAYQYKIDLIEYSVFSKYANCNDFNRYLPKPVLCNAYIENSNFPEIYESEGK